MTSPITTAPPEITLGELNVRQMLREIDGLIEYTQSRSRSDDVFAAGHVAGLYEARDIVTRMWHAAVAIQSGQRDGVDPAYRIGGDN